MDAWLALERQVLVGLVLILVSATIIGWRRHSSAAAFVAGAAVGAVFFVWVAGVRVIAPTEALWTLRLDWQWHFFGWHFFRHEPWHWPPGRIDGYFVPLGTTIGFTDAIPLAAFLLKPFASILPMPFQYLGVWLLFCFVLQGYFGVLVARLWSANVLVQVLSAACFVLVPTFLGRVGHAALCTHWLLLWTIWLYVRTDRDPARPLWRHATAIGVLVGLVHPYLAVMVLPLLGAIAVRLLLASRTLGISRALRTAVLTGAWPVCLVVAGWWASGLFTLSSVDSLAAGGLGRFSMNLLAVITPSGASTLLPEWPVATDGQAFEGFQYLGAGLLALLLVAALTRLMRAGPRLGVWWPLVLVCAGMAVYALSPRVTAGASVIADLHIAWLERASMFRSTGRFFWPAAYVLVTAALATLAIRVSSRVLVPLLAALVALQLVDLHGRHMLLRSGHLDPALYAWSLPLVSPAWHAALPQYDHLVLYPPPHCAKPPTSFEAAAYLAGLYGLTINDGLVARLDVGSMHRACQAIARAMQNGDVDPRTIYVLEDREIEAFRAVARRPLACGVIDNVGVCVTRESYASWHDAAILEE